MKIRRLTGKQESFCVAYLETGNGKEAYIRAYNAGTMKDGTIRVKASVLLGDDRIQARLEELRAPAVAKMNITVERITRELARIAFGNPRDLMAWDATGVRLKDSEELSVDIAASVQEVSSATSAMGGRSLKLKTHDKLKALELLGKQIGMFKDKGDDDDECPAPIRVEIITVDGRKVAA